MERMIAAGPPQQPDTDPTLIAIGAIVAALATLFIILAMSK
jgi:hypothetical protein